MTTNITKNLTIICLFFYFFFCLLTLNAQNANIEQIISQATEAYTKGNHNEAVSLLNKLLRAKPSDKNLSTRIFSLLKQWNILDIEVELLNKEKKSFPNAPFAYKILSELYLFMQSPLDALRELEVLVILDNNDIEALVQLGKIYKENHWFSEALKTFNKALNLQPESQEILILIGDTYLNSGDIKNAEFYWKKAIKFDENNINSYINYADILLRNGSYIEATNIYEQGRKHFNDDKQFSTQLSLLYETQMRYLEAVEEYVKIALPIIANNFDVNNWAVKKIIDIFKREKEIQNDIINVISKYKDVKHINRLLFELYFLKEDYNSSLKLAREISLNTKDEGEIFLYFGEILLKQGKYDFAIDFFKEGINSLISLPVKSINYEKFILKLGNAYQQSKDYSNAINTFKAITNSNLTTCDAAEAFISLGNIYEESEEFKLAEENFLTVVEKYKHCPTFELSLLKLIKTYIKSGALDKAIKIIEQTKYLPLTIEATSEIEFILGKIHYFKFDFSNAINTFKKITTNFQSKFINDSIKYILFFEELKNEPQILNTIAQADLLIEQKEFQEAKKVLSTLIEKNTLDEIGNFVIYKMSEVYVNEKNYTLAINSLNNIIENSTNEDLKCSALKLLAEIYEKTNDFDKAKKAYEMIIHKYPYSYWAEYSKNKIINE